MPSGRHQMDKVLDGPIKFKQENPKSLGSASYRRYRGYCRATTIREALYFGATRADLKKDEAARLLTRSPKKQMNTGRVMGGIITDARRYIAQRFFLHLGIQVRMQETIAQAQASLKAVDRVQARVQAEILKKIMAGKNSTLEDFVTYVKAAVAEEQKASPDLGVENWRYYSENKLDMIVASKLPALRKDPQISIAKKRIRVFQDSMENALRGWLKLTKASGISDLSEITGVEGMNAGRRAADDLAAISLKKGERPSDAMALKVLRLWGFEKSVSRQNVMPEGHDWVHSDTLGIIEDRNYHKMMISSHCKGHEHFVRFLCAWARKRSPKGVLPFTTISLNKNYAGRLHRDGGNIGPSVGIAIGPFTGGRLRFWAGDPQKGTRLNVEDVRKEPSLPLDIRRGVVFDGNCAHEVEPFTGERYSLIFFTVKKYKKTSPAVKRKLVSMGADWPTEASLQSLHAKVPRPAAK